MRDLSSQVKDEISKSAGALTLTEIEKAFPDESKDDLEYALWLLTQNREVGESCGQYRVR